MLTAIALDVFGHVQFSIVVDGHHHARSDDALETARLLTELGVENPLHLVQHARDWGSVEITKPE